MYSQKIILFFSSSLLTLQASPKVLLLSLIGAKTAPTISAIEKRRSKIADVMETMAHIGLCIMKVFPTGTFV